jgi:hypothetical protein
MLSFFVGVFCKVTVTLMQDMINVGVF